VRAALENELAGDNQRRDALLRQALDQSPNDASANWQLGRLCVQGAWRSPAEVQRSAQQDQRLAQYRRLRDAAQRTVADQAALARWCRKNRLEDEQRLHWLIVLQLQPDNAEAICALRLKPYLGTLMTPAQIEQVKKQIREIARAADRWRPLVAQWRSAAEHGDAALPSAVRQELVEISGTAGMLGVERALVHEAGAKRQGRAYRAMVLAMMPALGENPSPAAAEALARYAVFADFDDVRAAAVAGLQRHPLDHYAMLLLSGLQSPIDDARAVAYGPFGVVCCAYQEGALADLDFSYTLATPTLFRFDDGSVGDFRAAAGRGVGMFAAQDAPLVGAIEVANAQRNEQAASDFLDAVRRANEAGRQRNVRITAALRQLTGLDLGDAPLKWWKWWWQDYNEMYHVRSAGESEPYDQPPKPVYNCRVWREYVSLVPCSCFAPGTKVWTLTGRQPIEKIKIGDRVLAQDVDSGELAYKPVLAVTTRPPGPWVRLGLGTEALTTTPSHPFWVPGQGWRMAKQLEAGSRVHALSGGVPVENVETLKADPLNAGLAYNLIVADYSSYFVGDRGILVHDNTPRMPTAAILPGLARR
jgi:hypothetical protein